MGAYKSIVGIGGELIGVEGDGHVGKDDLALFIVFGFDDAEGHAEPGYCLDENRVLCLH